MRPSRETNEAPGAALLSLLLMLGLMVLAVRTARREARTSGRTIRSLVVEHGLLSDAEFEAAIASEAVMRLGSPDPQT